MLFIMVVFASIIIVAAGQVSIRAYESYMRTEQVAKEKQALDQEQSDLNQRIQNLASPEGIEKETKEHYNVKKPGEEVIIITNPNSGHSGATTTNSGSGFWQFIKNLFSK